MGTQDRTLLAGATTRAILDSFRDVHRELGFGYREFIYALALERDLVGKGHRVDREVAVMVYYRGEPLARQTLDMIVDQKVIVENKATEHRARAQLSSGDLRESSQESPVVVISATPTALKTGTLRPRSRPCP
jgi:GxxExxY protein